MPETTYLYNILQRDIPPGIMGRILSEKENYTLHKVYPKLKEIPGLIVKNLSVVRRNDNPQQGWLYSQNMAGITFFTGLVLGQKERIQWWSIIYLPGVPKPRILGKGYRSQIKAKTALIRWRKQFKPEVAAQYETEYKISITGPIWSRPLAGLATIDNPIPCLDPKKE